MVKEYTRQGFVDWLNTLPQDKPHKWRVDRKWWGGGKRTCPVGEFMGVEDVGDACGYDILVVMQIDKLAGGVGRHKWDALTPRHVRGIVETAIALDSELWAEK